MSIYAKFYKAFRVSCPIVTITTSDPAKAIQSIILAVNPKDGERVEVLSWDISAGFTIPAGQPKSAQQMLGKVNQETFSAPEALREIAKLDERTIVVIHNAHRYLDDIQTVQALWNLRDQFKSNNRMAVLMGSSIRVPVELQHDVIELDEPLPTHAELKQVIGAIANDAQVTVKEDALNDAASAAAGLSAFAAEQLSSLNLSRADGIKLAGLWGDKCAKINETPGLNVIDGGDFSDIAGVDNIKKFLRAICKGKDKPNIVVYVDEIEKSVSSNNGDSSGVSQDQLGVVLQWMQDTSATGAIFLGPPGAAKSRVAKATGGEAGVPTIQLDLGAMKGSLVGESEGRIREALKIVNAVSGGKTLWLATCNSIASLPPELRRRFKFGTWFFDLPDLEERKAIWTIYCGKYGHKSPSKELLAREWTGAEIETCCQIAHSTSLSLDDSAGYIVPVKQAAGAQIDALQSSAEGKYLSASKAGVYERPGVASQPTNSRKIAFE